MESLDNGNRETQSVLIKGYLSKRNWYHNKQLRFFMMYHTGEIMYHELNNDHSLKYKGTIQLGPETTCVLEKDGEAIKLSNCLKSANSKDKHEYILCSAPPDTLNHTGGFVFNDVKQWHEIIQKFLNQEPVTRNSEKVQ